MEFCVGDVFHIRPSSALKLRYNVFMILIDIDKIEGNDDDNNNEIYANKNGQMKFVQEESWINNFIYLFKWIHPYHLISSWNRYDHFDTGDKNQPLSSCIKELILKNCEIPKDQIGKIFLLTNPRYFGLSFNPVSVYYCYKKRGSNDPDIENEIIAVVLEVSNTPWLEKRLYVLPFLDQKNNQNHEETSPWKYSYRWKKDFHVSPFMDMLHDYCWSLNDPKLENEIHVRAVSYKRDKQPDIIEHDNSGEHTTGTKPTIKSEKKEKDEVTFVAGLNLKIVDLYSWVAIKSIIYQPFMTWMVILWIHIHAIKVWAGGKPYVNPPKNSPQLGLIDALRHLLVFSVSGIWLNKRFILILLFLTYSMYSILTYQL